MIIIAVIIFTVAICGFNLSSVMEAIGKIAEVIRDKNKNFRLNEAKKIMVSAGFFKTPRNANNILYTIIDRSKKFEKVEPGVYKVIPSE